MSGHLPNASDDPIHPPDANGWENPVHESTWRRQGPLHGRPRRRPINGDQEVEAALEAIREAEEDAFGDREVW